jgi:hypothetical protein
MELSGMLDGFRMTCLVVAAVRLGVVETLARMPAKATDLAAALGADAASLARLLRALHVVGLVEERSEGYALTSMGRYLVAEQPLADLAVLVDSEYLAAWAALAPSVLSGKTGVEHAFGTNVWQHRKAKPELNETFNRVMAGIQLRTAEFVMSSFDFSVCELVVDVGGGHGNVLARILEAYPRARGVVFDLAQVVEGAMRALGSAGLLHRCKVVAGSFLESIPGGGDVYLLQHVLHDWDDAHCSTLLENCRRAMLPRKTLLVVESVLPDDLRTAPRLALLDLHMMLVPGGRERTLAEYRGLLEDTGFELVRCSTNRPGGTSVIEARALP